MIYLVPGHILTWGLRYAVLGSVQYRSNKGNTCKDTYKVMQILRLPPANMIYLVYHTDRECLKDLDVEADMGDLSDL